MPRCLTSWYRTPQRGSIRLKTMSTMAMRTRIERIRLRGMLMPAVSRRAIDFVASRFRLMVRAL